jgi:Yip1-like protein
MANVAGGSITPFYTIWTEPRATIRRIVETDPTRNVIALVAVGPALNALASQWSKALGNNANLSVLWPLWVVVSVALEAALGVLFLYIFGAIFKWSGSLLGGVASRVEVRAAIAWSQVPGIAAEIVLLVAVLMGIPMPTPGATPGMLPHIDAAFYKVLVIEGVLGFWGFIVSLKCIGEVHRFSAWRAFVAILIPPLIVMVVVGLIVFVVIRLVGHH